MKLSPLDVHKDCDHHRKSLQVCRLITDAHNILPLTKTEVLIKCGESIGFKLNSDKKYSCSSVLSNQQEDELREIY